MGSLKWRARMKKRDWYGTKSQTKCTKTGRVAVNAGTQMKPYLQHLSISTPSSSSFCQVLRSIIKIIPPIRIKCPSSQIIGGSHLPIIACRPRVTLKSLTCGTIKNVNFHCKVMNKYNLKILIINIL